MQSESKLPNKLYGQSFFEEIAEGSLSSAQVIVPYLMEYLKPSSVLDVGCAEGAWLSVFKSQGVADCFGIDGDYVDRTRLLIDAKNFSAIDLAQGFSLGRRFDLAICLEVAEHLTVEAADRLVGSLVKHAPCVVFSASIPFQDGTGHINERWPDYWANLFRNHGYEAIDCIRPRVWNDKRVRWWFAQNTVIYFDTKCAPINELQGRLCNQPSANLLSLVHPELLVHKEGRIKQLLEKERWLQTLQKDSKSLRWLSRQLVKYILRRNS